MRSSVLRSVALVGLVFCVAACASDNGRRPERGSRDGRGPRANARNRPSLFISPAGQPFRADAGAPYPVTVWFAKADKDQDGKITRDEFHADFEAYYHTLDANHDGVVDGLEIADYERNIAPEILSDLDRPGTEGPAQRTAGRGGPGGPSGPGGSGGRRGGRRGGGQTQAEPSVSASGPARLQLGGATAFSLFSVSEPVSAADADFDGKVTLKEFLAAADRRFDLLDPKGVGYLTLDGLPRTPEQIAVEGRKPQRK